MGDHLQHRSLDRPVRTEAHTVPEKEFWKVFYGREKTMPPLKNPALELTAQITAFCELLKEQLDPSVLPITTAVHDRLQEVAGEFAGKNLCAVWIGLAALTGEMLLHLNAELRRPDVPPGAQA